MGAPPNQYAIKDMEQITIEPENTICEKCKCESDELFICERCDCEFCANCQAPYNQFTQIDFDCCKDCGEDAKRGNYD